MRGAQCTKCGAAIAQLISDCGRLCAKCLQASISSKLNKAIKVYFALEHGDAALVAVSGGACSMALAHMLCSVSLSDWSRPQAGKVACNLHIVYIDERAASRKSAALSGEYYDRVRTVVQTLASQYDSVHVCSLEDAFGAHRSLDDKLHDLKKMLACCTDDTSRQDVVRALRQQVLLAQAKELGCNKVLLGDSSTGLAARFVSMTAQGRGYASTAEVSMIDAREEACCVVRPLLGVPRKELALHCYFSGAPFLSDSRPASIKASITSQTEEFISDLYESRRNTVANITKLATKLQAFPFNDISRAPDPPLRNMVHGTDRFRRRVARQTPLGKAMDSSAESMAAAATEAVSLCKVCRSPVEKSAEVLRGPGELCGSCQRWILVDEDTGCDEKNGVVSDTRLPSHDRHAVES